MEVIGTKEKAESWEHMKWTEETEQKETAEIDGRQMLEVHSHWILEKGDNEIRQNGL